MVGVALDGSGVAVTIAQGGDERLLTGSHFLVAVGRVPNSDLLNTEAAGIRLDERGFIEVDDFCRTGAEGVFALGDIIDNCIKNATAGVKENTDLNGECRRGAGMGQGGSDRGFRGGGRPTPRRGRDDR